MRLNFFGATRTTTGSKHLLEANGKRILIECGMFQGRRSKMTEYNSKLPFDAGQVDVMLLSHAHIDHSGIIPVLARDGFRGRIYCTDATADLCKIMLLDSAHIQEQDAAFVSKKRAQRGEPPVAPMYTTPDAEAALELFTPIQYQQPIAVADGVVATWLDAGHILGSAMIVLEITERGRTVRLAFSGDVGRGEHGLLRDPEIPGNIDYLLTESTYGNRVHEPSDDVADRVCAMINRALARKGKIIIPAFAVGRTQQLLHTLYTLTQSRCIPVLPTYVDSPLAHKATEVFKGHPECFNQAFFEIMTNPQNPFSVDNLTYVQSVDESIALNSKPGPHIIISASGMAEAGRIRHHIKNNVGDDRNTILIVGWCAPHTLGAQLAAAAKEVTIFGERYVVRAAVETINAFSGHADKNELRAWVEKISGALRGIYVVHGEAEPAEAFAATLRGLYPQADIVVPEFGAAVEL